MLYYRSLLFLAGSPIKLRSGPSPSFSLQLLNLLMLLLFSDRQFHSSITGEKKNVIMSAVGSWKSAFSVPPFSPLVPVYMYHGCQTTYFRKPRFEWRIDSILQVQMEKMVALTQTASPYLQ